MKQAEKESEELFETYLQEHLPDHGVAANPVDLDRSQGALGNAHAEDRTKGDLTSVRPDQRRTPLKVYVGMPAFYSSLVHGIGYGLNVDPATRVSTSTAVAAGFLVLLKLLDDGRNISQS